MQREVSVARVKFVKTLRRVASSRCQPTTIKFSGHARAHRLQAMQRVSPVSGLMFKRGAPRWALRDYMGHIERILLGVNVLGVLSAEGDRQTLPEIEEKHAAQHFFHRTLVVAAGNNCRDPVRALANDRISGMATQETRPKLTVRQAGRGGRAGFARNF